MLDTNLAPHPTQLEDNAPMPDPPQFPPDVPPPACPVCGKTFLRKQERNRHLRSYLPHFIYCPFPDCPWRCDRYDNLRSHWQRHHAESHQVPQKHECEIYDPDPFVKSVNSGQMSIQEAGDSALIEVICWAYAKGKQDLWSEKWWGRRSRHNTAA